MIFNRTAAGTKTRTQCKARSCTGNILGPRKTRSEFNSHQCDSLSAENVDGADASHGNPERAVVLILLMLAAEVTFIIVAWHSALAF